jgi:glutathionyl-hydroquinone reductase
MGKLINGTWQTGEADRESTDSGSGSFDREDSAFRNWVTADGSAGPTGEAGFAAAGDRYHLYVSLACPWAHRTLALRRLKGLEDVLPLSVVNPLMGENGWSFEPGDGVVPDPLFDAQYLHEVYTAADPDYTGKVTVPVLFDKQRGTIVSNESADIIRMLNHAFDAFADNSRRDYYPAELQDRIDAINERVYATVNNGVYRAGFATSQKAYEKAVTGLFGSLDWLEDILSTQRYLVGDRMTEADWRLFTTLVRFDPVYHGHFKCNIRRIADYPNLSNYLRDLFQVPGIAATVDLDHIKQHYYRSHESVNPTGIVPLGPDIDYGAPHDRARFAAAA